MKPEGYRVEVNGIVQGVGFRPFVFKLAESLSLAGRVRNTTEGVLIEVEGPADALDAFVARLLAEAPPLAAIDSIKTEKYDAAGYAGFTISASVPGDSLNTLISPDISICADCRRELFDPADHRHLYPFINCTNCGPRYTIVCDVPYDRRNTTMKAFAMCPVCGTQYGEPADRRYHAQPVCCRDCGPELLLTDAQGRSFAGEPAGMAAELLAAGKILAVKSLGGYHLACSALDGNAVGELRRRKYRDEKPFALMARDLETAGRYCVMDESAVRLLQSPAAPIVLLPGKHGTGLPEQIASGNPNLGIMLPYTPLHLLLFFEEGGRPSPCPELLVMTSGNRSEEPICYEDKDACERLGGIADYFLTNNRPIRTRTDDSVVRAFRGGTYFIRRSRGYAPAPVSVKKEVLPEAPPSVLALGGELKNTFCISKGNRFFMSQHIGDLENLETLQSFEDGIEHYRKLFGIKPAVAAFDMHPAYLSTEYARTLENVIKVPVQHHHAHIASCMAENNLTGDVIGVAFDGTGYGEDGAVWGGEFFTGGYGQYKRAAHLEYFKLPGGEAAVREPWRVAAACLHQYGYDTNHLKDIPEAKRKLVVEMLQKNINCPRTSSMGRLFDAAAALTGVKQINRYEGQAAIELEHTAEGRVGEAYRYSVQNVDGKYVIGIGEWLGGILDDLAAGISPVTISGRFHGTVAAVTADICGRIRHGGGPDKVVLSGGVFQNILLLSACMDMLEQSGFRVFIHRKVPANDGGIALGQAVIAMARYRNI